MDIIKIYGQKRTGTNYTEFLLKKNFPDTAVLVNHTGWKHGDIIGDINWSGANWESPKKWPGRQQRIQKYISEISHISNEVKEAYANNSIKYVLCVKNPYSWYHSWFMRYKGGKSHPIDLNVLKMWRDSSRQYVNFAGANGQVVLVRYEDYLVEDGVKNVLTEVSELFGIALDKDNIVDQDRVISPGASLNTKHIIEKKKFNKSFYINREYMKTYSDQDIDKFKKAIPEDLMNEVGYSHSDSLKAG